MENIIKFKESYALLKNKGFVKARRVGNTGIGKTLEDLLNIVENNIDAPDLHGFEIKGQRALSGSYITLFTRAPTWPKAANSYLREHFGTPDEQKPEMKVLHTSIFGHRYNTHKSGYKFKLCVDRDNEKIILSVRKMEDDTVVSNDVYWSFDVINKILTDKINRLVYVNADVEHRDDGEYFDFNNATMFIDTNLEKFLTLLEAGSIMFDIRIGVYRQGKYAGKTHDHGSGFRIKRTILPELYQSTEII